MTGKVFGRLTVLAFSHIQLDKATWRCRCACGNETDVRGDRLRRGTTQSCGCLARDRSRERKQKDRKDLTGQRFGHWTVLAFHSTRTSEKGGGMTLWRCRCDCGTEKVVQYTGLTVNADPKCRACAGKERQRPDFGLSLLFKRYRNNARTRGLTFELTREQFDALVGQPCHYCGGIKCDSIQHPKDRERFFRHNGIDRLNAGGYTIENSVPCCWACNRMKSDLSMNDFIARCRGIAQQHPA